MQKTIAIQPKIKELVKQYLDAQDLLKSEIESQIRIELTDWLQKQTLDIETKRYDNKTEYLYRKKLKNSLIGHFKDVTFFSFMDDLTVPDKERLQVEATQILSLGQKEEGILKNYFEKALYGQKDETNWIPNAFSDALDVLFSKIQKDFTNDKPFQYFWGTLQNKFTDNIKELKKNLMAVHNLDKKYQKRYETNLKGWFQKCASIQKKADNAKIASKKVCEIWYNAIIEAYHERNLMLKSKHLSDLEFNTYNDDAVKAAMVKLFNKIEKAKNNNESPLSFFTISLCWKFRDQVHALKSKKGSQLDFLHQEGIYKLLQQCISTQEEEDKAAIVLKYVYDTWNHAIKAYQERDLTLKSDHLSDLEMILNLNTYKAIEKGSEDREQRQFLMVEAILEEDKRCYKDRYHCKEKGYCTATQCWIHQELMPRQHNNDKERANISDRNERIIKNYLQKLNDYLETSKSKLESEEIRYTKNLLGLSSKAK